MPQKTGSWKEPNYKVRIHSGSGASAEHRSSLETDGEIEGEIGLNAKVEIKFKIEGFIFMERMCVGGGYGLSPSVYASRCTHMAATKTDKMSCGRCGY